MKTYPKGTTKEQWDRYEIDKANHEAYCDSRMPKEQDFITQSNDPQGDSFDEAGYKSAMREWQMMKSMDAPNEPGYYRANND